MAHIPPLFPEPITVPGNVSDAGYFTVVGFLRRTSFFHLASIALIVLLTFLWLRLEPSELPTKMGAEGTWALSIIALVALALSRSGPVLVQTAAFILFAVSLSGLFAIWTPFVQDEFPDLAKALGWTLASAYVSLLAYNIIAVRDYSLIGCYCLVLFSTAISLIVFTIASDVWFSQALAVFVVQAGLLLYWIYDLAMVLRRRTPREFIPAALDLYRDTLNFVGFPIRVMRMPRRRRRLYT
jgi:hypothetical protein